MPDKMPTYRVNEELLRSKLLGYEVEVDAARCEAIEQEVANLRFKKPINLPKVNLKIVVPALILIALTTVICFNLETIKDIFTPAPDTKAIENKVTPPVSKPTLTVSTESVAVSPVPTPTQVAVQSPVQNATISKVDSAAIKKTDTAKQETSKKPNPVMAQPPSDSAAKVNNASKQDTAVQNSDPPVKKKKKRRRRNANLDELKKSTLESNGSDDDVVVPN